MLDKKRIAFSTFALLTVRVALADYSYRGKPTDVPHYHEDVLGYVLLFIVLIAGLIIGFAWLSDTVKRNKEKIADTLGLIFVAALFIGAIFIVGTCASSLKSNKKYKDAAHLDSNYSISERISGLALPKQNDTSILHREEASQKGNSNLAYIPGDSIKIGNTTYHQNTANADTVPATIVFYPQNAIIVDEQGSHNFEHFDCPNMNVTDDNGKRVVISWGGDNVVLYKCANNDDTYLATGHTSRGDLTLRAFRSSSSGQIYLVTATMPNPTSDVKQITINFKH